MVTIFQLLRLKFSFKLYLLTFCIFLLCHFSTAFPLLSFVAAPKHFRKLSRAVTYSTFNTDPLQISSQANLGRTLKAIESRQKVPGFNEQSSTRQAAICRWGCSRSCSRCAGGSPETTPEPTVAAGPQLTPSTKHRQAAPHWENGSVLWEFTEMQTTTLQLCFLANHTQMVLLWHH